MHLPRLTATLPCAGAGHGLEDSLISQVLLIPCGIEVYSAQRPALDLLLKCSVLLHPYLGQRDARTVEFGRRSTSKQM